MPKKAKGTPIITFRCLPELRARLDRYLASTEHAVAGQKSATEFITQAIAEKLAHLERSKGRRKARPASVRAADAALDLLATLAK